MRWPRNILVRTQKAPFQKGQVVPRRAGGKDPGSGALGEYITIDKPQYGMVQRIQTPAIRA